MIFKASLDGKARIITASIIALFAAIIVVQSVLSTHTGSAVPIITGVTSLVLFITTFSLRPRHYEVTNSQVIVHRLAGKVYIEKQDIVSVAILQEDQLDNALRTFGVYGMFGYYGKFYTVYIGTMTLYATRMDTPVLITMKDGRKIVLTPDEPVRFLAALK